MSVSKKDKAGYDTTGQANADRCLVVHPNVRQTGSDHRTPQARLDEIVGLAMAINLDVVHKDIISVTKVRPSTLFGKGRVEQIGAVIAGDGGGRIDVVVVNARLTPIQQRNLERAWQCKVIDRTGLILEIFGERARTSEGRLQVDLASLTYLRSRLVRSWTHLERQRGGAGFMGGPGETQIETDRRLIGKRITRIKRELEEVKRTRQLHRKARRRVPHRVVGLIGYTNAGKSTLFNTLTHAGVEVKDQVFATLDTTMRGIDLPSGKRVILSDTVGFISDLPHELVTAFHATLEEVMEADILVHVRDISHPGSEDQKNDVLCVLKELGVETEGGATTIIEVLNKTDLLAQDERETVINRAARTEGAPAIPISALSGEGCADLLSCIETTLSREHEIMEVSLDPGNGAAMAWLYEHGEVLERFDGEAGIVLRVRLSATNRARWDRRKD